MYRCDECGADVPWAHSRDCQTGREWHDLLEEFFMGGLDFLMRGDTDRLARAGEAHRKMVPSAWPVDQEGRE